MEEKLLIDTLVNSVRNGDITLEEVPVIYRDQVTQILTTTQATE